MGATIAGGLVSTTTRRMTAVNIHLEDTTTTSVEDMEVGLNGPALAPATMERRPETEAAANPIVPDQNKLRIGTATTPMELDLIDMDMAVDSVLDIVTVTDLGIGEVANKIQFMYLIDQSSV